MMDWETILKYRNVINWIARKYSGDPDLAEDVTQEVILKLYEDKKLDISKFDPAKRDAAIRQTIRNKVIKVLRSKKVGRWTMDSLDHLIDAGFQIDLERTMFRDEHLHRKLTRDDVDREDLE